LEEATMADLAELDAPDYAAHFARAKTLDELQRLIEPLNVVTGWSHGPHTRSADRTRRIGLMFGATESAAPRLKRLRS
jgi:hypothetical protein